MSMQPSSMNFISSPSLPSLIRGCSVAGVAKCRLLSGNADRGIEVCGRAAALDVPKRARGAARGTKEAMAMLLIFINCYLVALEIP